MANLDLLENSIPVAPLKIAALKGCTEMANTVNNYLVEFRKDLVKRQANGINWSGYVEDSYLIDCDCPRFGSGEAKGKINESVRGVDLFILVDVCNYSIVLNILITEVKFKNIIFNELKADNLISSFFIGNIYSENVNDFIIFHTNGDRQIQELILDLCLEQVNQKDYYKYMINADILKLLGLLLRNYERTCDVPRIRKKKDSENFSILQYIEQNYRSLTLLELAEHFHYSAQHMSHRLKQITGMAFTEYLLQKRMKLAADMLANTSVRVKSIGENAGYQSQEHFIRTFRKYYGVTPGAYRAMHQKG